MSRYVGIDVGGTSVKLGAVILGPNEPPDIVATHTWDTPVNLSPSAVVSGLSAELQVLLDQAGWDTYGSIGLGLPGLVRDRRELLASPHLHAWTGPELVPGLADAAGVRVTADNDAANFARTEWHWGAGRGGAHVIFLTLGTGIGGAVVAGNRIHSGAAAFTAEPGHVSLNVEGLPCACGNRGCAEMYVTRDAVVRYARESEEFKDRQDLTPAEVHRSAEAGSQAAMEAWRRAGTALGDLLVSLVNLFNPSQIVVGGGIAQAGRYLLDPARERLAERSLVAGLSSPAILPAGFGVDAGWVGAAALAWEAEAGG